MTTPASPWIGSTRKATVLDVIASFSAVAAPKAMILKPGANGPKWSRAANGYYMPCDRVDQRLRLGVVAVFKRLNKLLSR